MKYSEERLVPLVEDDREQFILDNQWAFGMFLGLISPAVVAIVTVLTSKNKALINDFKKKLIGFYRIKP